MEMASAKMTGNAAGEVKKGVEIWHACLEVEAEGGAVDECLEDTGGKVRKGKGGYTSGTGAREGSHSKQQLMDLDRGHLTLGGEDLFWFFPSCQIGPVEIYPKERDPGLDADRKCNQVRKHQLDPVASPLSYTD